MGKILNRCKNCKYLHYIGGDFSRCHCAITGRKVDLEGRLERIFCKWFKAKEDDIDI